MKTEFFVVAGPGYCGDRTCVLSAHARKDLALKAARKFGTGYVVREGSKKKGDTYLSATTAVFPIVARVEGER